MGVMEKWDTSHLVCLIERSKAGEILTAFSPFPKAPHPTKKTGEYFPYPNFS